jgi:uncharacterized protein
MREPINSTTSVRANKSSINASGIRAIRYFAMAADFSDGSASQSLGKPSHWPDNKGMNETPEQRGFQFPGAFEISVMGAAEASLEVLLLQTLADLGLTAHSHTLRIKPSSKGTYISVTVVFEAHSREDYDAAHGALRARPEVKWTL